MARVDDVYASSGPSSSPHKTTTAPTTAHTAVNAAMGTTTNGYVNGNSNNNNNNNNKSVQGFPLSPPAQDNQRPKSSVLRSFLHRRNPSDGTALPPAPLVLDTTPKALANNARAYGPFTPRDPDSAVSVRYGALEELQRNQQDSLWPRSPRKTKDDTHHHNHYFGGRSGGGARSPTKAALATFGLRSPSKDKDANRLSARSRESSPTRPKKAKSSTHLAALLPRPRSSKNLQKTAAGQDTAAAVAGESKDKENRAPSTPTLADMSPPPPIWAQFCIDGSDRQRQHQKPLQQQGGPGDDCGRLTTSSDFRREDFLPPPNLGRRSFIGGSRSAQPSFTNLREEAKNTTGSSQRLSKVLSAVAAMGQSRTKVPPVVAPVESTETPPPQDSRTSYTSHTSHASHTSQTSNTSSQAAPRPSSTADASDPPSASDMPHIDPKDIDRHLEAMLDRRNIPENQRYKMRNLNNDIKTEFIRQDWAERPRTIDSATSNEAASAAAIAVVESEADEKDKDKEKPKRGRGKSFTLSLGSKDKKAKDKDRDKDKDKDKEGGVKKQKGEGTLGRHFRSKSTDSIVSLADRWLAEPASSGNGGGGGDGGSSGSGIFSKIKLQQGPADFVAYLRKVQRPELVEVGKLHKLRLLLRNETVSWTENFIQHGGMKEIVGLLNRIMEIEWREEHEDALLHENLLCLKALCTTALALQYLHSIQADLFPRLLRMLFDPERKGPSEFTTRNIVTAVLFTYIQSAAAPVDRRARALTVLDHLRDPVPREEERPLAFVMEMRRERPFRVWCKEAVSVTKEVFWIFLHHLNVVPLPGGGGPDVGSGVGSGERDLVSPKSPTLVVHSTFFSSSPAASNYMSRHFPQERPPVPAAPYVGGVEWDATNYLASHLDLLNAIVACTPTVEERNQLRADLRISGWERCLGGSLRLCKEKFYGAVHDGLRTWVAAAAEDGWDVKDVRYGPPPGEKRSGSPAKKQAQGKKAEDKLPPRIEMPRLSFGLDMTKPVTGNGQGVRLS